MLNSGLIRAIKNCDYLKDELKGVSANSAQVIVEGYAIIGNFLETHLNNME